MINCLVWNEFVHENNDAEVAAVYPEAIHGAIAAALGQDAELNIRTATLQDAEQGLTQENLDWADVVFWWGHAAHDKVDDELVAKLWNKIIFDGVGLVALHSGHFSKIFKKLMGTGCDLLWREAGEAERLWVVEPNHPIAAGLPNTFRLPHEEMYGERFDIPAPDELVFMSWFQGGEVFRSGCTWNRGRGKVFYFRPGHETFPTYRDANVCQVLRNAAHYCAKPAFAGVCKGSEAYGHRPNNLEPFTVGE